MGIILLSRERFCRGGKELGGPIDGGVGIGERVDAFKGLRVEMS